MMRELEILVVGGGIAGVSAATCLARAGADVLLAERAENVPRRFHGESLQPYGVMLLRRLGMAPILDELSSQPIREFRFADLDAGGGVSAEVVVPYPEGHTALAQPNFELTSALWKFARSRLGERFVTGATVRPAGGCTSRRPRLIIERPGAEAVTVAPKWVVAADGRNSAMRARFRKPVRARNCVAAAGLDLIVGGTLTMRGSVTDRCTVVRGNDNGTFSFFPLDAARHRVYWNAPVSTAHGGRWRDKLRDALELLPSDLRSGTLDDDVAVTTAETRWNGSPAIGRYLFAGDAAAVTTPFGGQGMTCALEHAETLLQLLRARDQGAGAVRRAYAAAVRRSFRRVGIVNLFLYHVFFSRSRVTRPLARYVVHGWAADPSVAQLVAGLFSGVDCRRASPGEVMRILGLRPSGRLVRALALSAQEVR